MIWHQNVSNAQIRKIRVWMLSKNKDHSYFPILYHRSHKISGDELKYFEKIRRLLSPPVPSKLEHWMYLKTKNAAQILKLTKLH